jgi:hypothetical protein
MYDPSTNLCCLFQVQRQEEALEEDEAEVVNWLHHDDITIYSENIVKNQFNLQPFSRRVCGIELQTCSQKSI